MTENFTIIKIIMYVAIVFLTILFFSSYSLDGLKEARLLELVSAGILIFFSAVGIIFKDFARKHIGQFMYLIWLLSVSYMMYSAFAIYPEKNSIGILFVFLIFPIIVNDKYYKIIFGQFLILLSFLILASFFKDEAVLSSDILASILVSIFGLVLGLFILSLKMQAYSVELMLKNERDNLSEVSRELDFSLKTQKILSNTSINIQNSSSSTTSELDQFFTKIRLLFDAELSFLLLIEGKGLAVYHKSIATEFNCLFVKDYIPFGFLKVVQIQELRERRSLIYSDEESMRSINESLFEKCEASEVQHLIITPVKKNQHTIGAIGIANSKVSPSVIKNEILMSISNTLTDLLKIDENNQFLERLSYLDEQSGLANRNAYERLILNTKYNLSNYNFGVMFIDLDKLKETNDILGHSFGDKLIKTMGDFIKNEFPSADSFRIGGDEFLIVDFNTTREKFLERVECFKTNIKNYPELKASIGYKFNTDKVNIEKLVSIADKYMYIEKKSRYKGSRETR